MKDPRGMSEDPREIEDPQWLWEQEGSIRQRQRDKVTLTLQFAP